MSDQRPQIKTIPISIEIVKALCVSCQAPEQQCSTCRLNMAAKATHCVLVEGISTKEAVEIVEHNAENTLQEIRKRHDIKTGYRFSMVS